MLILTCIVRLLRPIYFVVCIHSHLGEKGHLRCGFDTRFLPSTLP